jgi:hypothetical protein
MSRTHTRTHTEIRFANPYLICDQCRRPVPAWHDPDKCGCNPEAFGFWNEPCGHRAGTASVCPSWGPVDGCQCAEVLGSVEHTPAPLTGAQP